MANNICTNCNNIGTKSVFNNVTKRYAYFCATHSQSQAEPITTQPNIIEAQPAQERSVKIMKKVKTFKYGDTTIEAINSTSDYVPTEAIEVILDKSDKTALGLAINENIPTLLIGETGTGKSSVIKYLAFKRQQPYIRVNMNGYTTPDELIGRMAVKDGATYFEEGTITKAMREGAILVLDEVNGTTQDCLFILHGLLDNDRMITLSDGTVVRPHKDFRVFATCNPDYEGTKTMNKAFVDRFGIILSIDVLSPKREADLLVQREAIEPSLATDLVTIATMLRKDYAEQKISTYISTRGLLNVAHLVKQGLKPNEAYKVAVEQKTTNKDEQKALHDVYLAVFKQADTSNNLDKPIVTTQREIEELQDKAASARKREAELVAQLTTMELNSNEASVRLTEAESQINQDIKKISELSDTIKELQGQVESYKRLDAIIKSAASAQA